MDTEPSTRYHPLPNRLINLATRTLNSIGLARIDLSAAGLLAAARQQTGLDRFGDESFLPALRVLIDSLESEARLNPFGRLHARAKLLGSLKNRLWANACFEAHPEIRARKIVAPIVIVGPHCRGRAPAPHASADAPEHLTTWEGFQSRPRLGLGHGRAARYTEAGAGTRRAYPARSSAIPRTPPGPGGNAAAQPFFCSFAFIGECPFRLL
jgi:hypothetical protein